MSLSEAGHEDATALRSAQHQTALSQALHKCGGRIFGDFYKWSLDTAIAPLAVQDIPSYILDFSVSCSMRMLYHEKKPSVNLKSHSIGLAT